MSTLGEGGITEYLRPKTVKPRAKGFIYRPIISVVDGVGMLESGEVVYNLPIFAFTTRHAHIWVTLDAPPLAKVMHDYFGKYEWFCMGGSSSSDPNANIQRTLGIPKGQIKNFGFDSKAGGSAPGRPKSARHIICDPVRMFGNPKSAHNVIAAPTHSELRKFMQDFREWCSEQDIPLGQNLASIGSSLLRDKRFWPEARGKVPRASNERIRPYLPAVHNELHGDAKTIYPSVIALDQRRAYHTIAQEIPTPDPDNFFARGYFHEPDTHKLWTKPGRKLYERTVSQPGLLAVRGTSRGTRKGEPRLPCLDFTGTKVVYIWSNELDIAIKQGLSIHGLTAAWTSKHADSGLPLYGKWALAQIDNSSNYRKRWLKPTLHSTYGLLGARVRNLEKVELRGDGELVDWYFHGVKFTFHRKVIEKLQPDFVHTAMLGALQAEVRKRTLNKAEYLVSEGGKLLHTHADGLHIVMDQLPLMDDKWTADTLTRLWYEDPVSYYSNEKVCLPGRKAQEKYIFRKRQAHLIKSLKRRKWYEHG